MRFILALFLMTSVFFATNTKAAYIDFNDYVISSNYGGQYTNGGYVISDDGLSLTLSGNLWVAVLARLEADNTSTLFFDFSATGSYGEIYAVGFDDNTINNNPGSFYQLGGSQSSGMNIYDSYSIADGTVEYSILLSELTGTFYNWFVVALDNDANTTGSSITISNVEICSNPSSSECLSAGNLSEPISEPSTTLLLIIGMLFISVYFRKRYN
ncbi:hypothetical protein [Alteromonas gilva]|uniref:PEP-CTERM sorting domain-containing protein n=1 Tax=Alteromonas gilva TaxID=2987522 RepID=A0ABT5KXQ9_9ALTE|nr:hypothetical protein [Alteromonas gilva]MDC8829550.1 hypothetical protein [Alteromonas gilva]